MVNPISSLANMEMKLYGGLNYNSAVPSYANNYCTPSSYNYLNNYNTYNNYGQNSGYNYSTYNTANNPANSVTQPYGTSFGQVIPPSYSQASIQQPSITQNYQNIQPETVDTSPQYMTQNVNNQVIDESIFKGLNKGETDALKDYYSQSLSPSESFTGAATGQAVFAAVSHPRLFVHPINSIKAYQATNKLFAGIKDSTSFIGELWKNPATNDLVRESYFQAHKATARLNSKMGLFRQSYTGESKALVEGILNEMKDAIANNNKEKLAECTAKLQQINVNDGKLLKPYNWIKSKITGKDPATVADKLNNTAAIDAAKNKLLNGSPTKFKDFLKAESSPGGALLFAGMCFAGGIGKIKTAFAKDKENEQNGISSNLGWKQVAQTTTKSIGTAAGWSLGCATGKWAFSKIGAKIGTMLGGGIGAAIGGIIGFVGGGLGMWLSGKATEAIAGKDVADDIEAENLTKTPEGQVALLQHTVQNMQAGKEVPLQAQQAAQKILTQYA